jgi:DNA-directed RNA polymerase subunit L
MVGKYTNLGTVTDPKAFPDDLEIVPTRSRIVGAFDFLLKGHDHTLGNLLQTWLSENNMNAPVLATAAPAPGDAAAPAPGDAAPAPAAATPPPAEAEAEAEAGAAAQAGGARSSALIPISYVGYEIPHPLRDEMVLRISVESGKQMDAQKAFAQACSGCANIFKEMRNAWNQKVNPGAVTGATLKRKPVALPAKATTAATAATAASAPVENIEAIRSALKAATAPAPAPTPTSAAAPTKSAVLRRKK